LYLNSMMYSLKKKKKKKKKKIIVRITKTRDADENLVKRSSSSEGRLVGLLEAAWKAKPASVAIYRAMYYKPVA